MVVLLVGEWVIPVPRCELPAEKPSKRFDVNSIFMRKQRRWHVGNIDKRVNLAQEAPEKIGENTPTESPLSKNKKSPEKQNRVNGVKRKICQSWKASVPPKKLGPNGAPSRRKEKKKGGFPAACFSASKQTSRSNLSRSGTCRAAKRTRH